jgi:glycosyltransferase involved in cell wall biosynthesis
MQHYQKIAFVKYADFSHTNTKVLEILKTNFPEFQIDVIDIFPDLIGTRDPLNLIFCLKEYGKDILLGKKNLSSITYLRTPYIVNKVRKAIVNKLSKQKYVFTFQTQSLFDASLPGVPHFVYTDHTHLANLQYPGFNPQDIPPQALLEYEKKIYQNSTLNLTMSSNISESMIKDYSCNPQKIACVYCGANTLVKEDEIFEEKRYSNQNILFVGTEWERKGGPVLIEAFKKVLKTYPDASLTIVGCTPQLDVPNCNVVGRIPLAEVKQYFQKASIFCLPTILEPFGIVFLEAMAHKLPIIGSNIGAIPEFLHDDHNGYLVETNNSEQLSQKIIKLIGSPEKCMAFGEYGHQLFWSRYTWKKTGEKIHENIRLFLV